MDIDSFLLENYYFIFGRFLDCINYISEIHISKYFLVI